MIESFKEIEEQSFCEINEDEIERKIVKKYIDELEKIKNNKQEIDNGEKLADKYKRVLEKTLLKLWENKKFNNILRKYVNANMIRTVEYKAGHKLNDEDLEYLDDQLMGINCISTPNPDDKGKVKEMVRPIIKIYYKDEDEEMDYTCILGSCKYYR